ncbi:hypothetical protein LV89_00686 [Arcicella aurantiaca]|uniref:Outer membrane protein with beta-barrel domain n=1 Tax=Arcicella aurantiaca TaxID=591202 RepID=A0A316EC77_9BACT|nr:hypothetical protein [Arcicella aurantiaca]PWK28482.1 hypothetical protein LV89_00686 [Arcicella aurantiaca]
MFKKQIFVALCLFVTPIISNGQAKESPQKDENTYLEKGTWLLGGNLSYINVSTKYASQSYSNGLFLGSISAANMVTPNIAIGGKITYVNSSNTGAAILGPMARYYFNNNKPAMPFLLGEVTVNTNGGSAGYNLGAGLANFLSKNVSIDMIATYGNSYSLGGIPYGATSNLMGPSIGVFALQAGLQIYIP